MEYYFDSGPMWPYPDHGDLSMSYDIARDRTSQRISDSWCGTICWLIAGIFFAVTGCLDFFFEADPSTLLFSLAIMVLSGGCFIMVIVNWMETRP